MSKYRHTGLYMPTTHYVGTFPNNGGRGRGIQGRGRGKKDNSQHYNHYRHDQSPYGRQVNHNEHFYDQYNLQRTPVHTYNRFSPLREGRSREVYDYQYAYMDREENHYNRSPFNYNQNHPGPSHMGGFLQRG